MQVTKFAELAERLETLLGDREGDDAVRCPFVGPDGGWLGALADEGELIGMVLL